MFTLIKFNNGLLSVYPSKAVRKNKGYVVVKHKNCRFQGQLLAQHGKKLFILSYLTSIVVCKRLAFLLFFFRFLKPWVP